MKNGRLSEVQMVKILPRQASPLGTNSGSLAENPQ